MLSQQDNEMLTHVGPGTPMGNLLRQYWAPALLSEELPSPDCPPIRVKLMCEELIAFRNTSGEVGLVANACPHRAPGHPPFRLRALRRRNRPGAGAEGVPGPGRGPEVHRQRPRSALPGAR